MNVMRFLLTVLILMGVNANAAEYFSGKTMKVAFGDTLDQDVFAGCNEVQVFGYAAGDIYAGCENIIIEGKVQDDVLVGCRNFKLTGIINDGLIVFAETITIDGIVRGDVLAFGREVRLTDRAKLEGNLYTGCAQLIQEGAPVAGFVKGSAGYADLNGAVGGVVDLKVKNIDFGDEYTAGEGTFITVPEDFDQSDLSYVPPDLELDYEETTRFFQKTFFYLCFLAFLVTGLVIILVFRSTSRDYLTYVRSNLPVSLLAGLIIVIVTPVVVTIISLFIVTIPIAMIIFVLYLILIYLSFVFSALHTGDLIWSVIKRTNGNIPLFWPFVLGLIVICLVMQIPYLGWLLALAFICFGTGSAIMFFWNTRRAANTVTE